jgi:hypothetical protein
MRKDTFVWSSDERLGIGGIPVASEESKQRWADAAVAEGRFRRTKNVVADVRFLAPRY